MGADHGDWNKTILVENRLSGTRFYDEPTVDNRHGKWQGRPIIARDTPINGGVYLGGSAREAIVVDDIKQPLLDAAYQQLLERQNQKYGEFKKSGILSEVYDLAIDLLPYNSGEVSKLTQQLQPDQKIALSVFINAKAGVCRHQALLVGYLLERLNKEGLVNGKVSVDRNSIPGKGGHAWARYTNSAKEVFIIDPAQQFIGKLSEIPENAWFYKRPGE